MPDIVQKFSLNTEQTRIFRIVRSHVERTLEFQQNTGLNRKKAEQVLMYIGACVLFLLHLRSRFAHTVGGAGVCGKSRVIEAISDYMYLQGRLHTVRMLAPSSAAAVGINGLTIQSMLHERRNKPSSDNSQLTQTRMSVVKNEWRNIDYCFIDEISMVGCYMLAQFHKITTIAKHTLATVPFGFYLMTIYPIPSPISPTEDAQCLKEIFSVKSEGHFGYKSTKSFF